MSAVRSYDGIAVTAPYTQPYERYSEHAAPWFLGQTLRGVLAAAGLDKGEVDGLSVTSMTLAPDSPASIADHFGLGLRWLESSQQGGAAGLIALNRAARAVQAGDADIVACIAGDSHRRGGFGASISNFSRFSMDAVHPYGAGGPNTVFALITRAYMDRYGVGREDFGRLCIEQRNHAAANPNALLREPLTLSDYLDARPVAEPLHLYDCVMPCAGGEGFLVMSDETADRLGLTWVQVRGLVERHNAFSDDPVQLRGGWHQDGETLLARAGMAPGDADFIQTYDDYPVISFLQLEALGICPEGEAAGLFVDAPAGRIAHNTSGGQLSVGQAGFAGGFLGLTEALRQLMGQGSLEAPRLGLVSGFGFVNYDRGVCASAAVLERGP
jgi:acetyl-CoA acetyltransferase